jgi:hypothetical protein
MNDAGYRTPSSVPSCSRCKAPLDVGRAVLSSEGLPLCPRCDAEAKIAAAAAPPQAPGAALVETAARRIPWNDAVVSLGVGAALLVGAPVCAVGMWHEWLPLEGTLAFYGIGMPVVIVTTVRALARASKARSAPPPGAMPVHHPGAGPPVQPAGLPAPPPPVGSPQAHPHAQRDAALASVGAGMAVGGCGAIAVVLVVAGIVAVAVLAYVAWLFLKILGVLH